MAFHRATAALQQAFCPPFTLASMGTQGLKKSSRPIPGHAETKNKEHSAQQDHPHT
jgi:hypothetical protein